MIVYNYHPATKEFTHKEQAMPDPVEIGNFLIPAHATNTAPPIAKAGKARCWINSGWKYVDDYRGREYWDTNTGEKILISGLGETPLPHWTEFAPIDSGAVWDGSVWKIPLEILKERKIAQIRYEADAVLNGIKSNFSEAEFQSWSKQESGAKDLQSNPESQSPDAQFVRNIAYGRGISIENLVGKILSNINPYAESLSRILGEQQRREDLVNAATNPKQLSSI